MESLKLSTTGIPCLSANRSLSAIPAIVILGSHSRGPMKLTRALALSLLALAAFAQPKPQPQDDEFARLVKEWTTRPEFMSPLVDHLPKAPGIPTVKDVLGYYSGAPKHLTHVADLNKYYRALAAAS